MLDNLFQIITGTVLLSVVGIAYGGTFLLKVARGGVPANDLQQKFFRAGHAHAGVLVILGLLVLQLTQLNDVDQLWQALSLGVLLAAIVMPGGFFLSVAGRDPQRPNRFIALLWGGAALLVVGLASAGIGLIAAGTN
jgi:hypothetical protein